ncbi:MAG: hypothetical protein SCALA702_14450 [Melioribacteraceae bacterium]|nr:MAG: hypothetical protein SCALA702_14450 [Melioribacteraceae bacterium]
MTLVENLKRTITVLLLLSVVTFAQSVIQVPAGTDVLKPAIDGAAAGDIIELITDGGEYLSADQIEIDKDITIRAAVGLTAKPILKYVGESTGAYMFKLVASPFVKFEGIEFDGDGTGQGGAALAKYALRLDNGDPNATMKVHVMDCVMHDFNEKIIKPYGDCGMDELIVHNSTFYNGAKEGITLYSGSSSDPAVALDYAEFLNCTFYNFVREGIKADTNPNTVMRVNHCTFYNCGETSKGMLYVDDLLDVEVKNSIFVNNGFGDYFTRYEGDQNIFKNVVFYDVASHSISGATVTDTLFADPMFADAANGDFTLDMMSPAIGYADDGYAVGDSRWDPTASMPQVHYVLAGTDVLKPVIDAAAEGDTVELTSSGGEYLSADQIVIDKDIYLRAKAGLAEKPILKYIGESTGAYMFKLEESPKVVFEGLELDGDGTGQGGAALAKYALRLDNGNPDGTMDVRVYDCVMHDFNEKIIKPYGDCGMDSLIVHNSTFYNGTKEGITLYSGSSSDPAVALDYAEFYNCTFYNFVREGIKADTNPDIVMRVNQCTFYNCGESSKSFLFVDDLLDVEVKNSVFMTNSYGDYWARFESDQNIFKNSVFYDVATHEVSSGTVSDTLFADPLFADAANGDFTLAAGSPARTAGEGGNPAGDLRWAIDPNAVLLTILTDGQGVVNLDPPGGIYSPGTSVTLTAVPDAGWAFVGWDGITVFPPDNPVANITINENMTVTAQFVSNQPQVTLTVDSLGLGSVAVDPAPGPLGTYDQGTEITLTATAQPDWHFVEWLGDVTGTDNPVTFTLDSNMVVTGSFASDFTQYTLTLDKTGLGEVYVDPQPILGTYDSNAVEHLNAVAAQGWQFDGFTGDLTSTSAIDSVLMDGDKSIMATFSEIQFGAGALEIEDTYDLYDAVMLANNNSIVDTLVLVTSGGLYTTQNTADVAVTKPLVIMAKPGLDEKPIITNSDSEASNLDIFRVFEDFKVEGVVFDGGHEMSHGMKYAVRLSNYTDGDTVRHGANQIFINCDFLNMYEAKDPSKDGHIFKIDKDVRAGKVMFEGCTVNGTGYEAIRISDTEKWPTDRALDTLIVRNCTFTNCDAEAIRYYSDPVDDTPDAPLFIQHVTFDHTATRVMYLKNSGGAVVENIIISNSISSGHGRDDDLMDAQGTSMFMSYVNHVDTFNVKAVPIKSTDGQVDEETVYGIDPMYEDAGNQNWTLLETSHLYGLASDGEAIGDLRWATNTSVNVELALTVTGLGQVMLDPAPIGKTYAPGTVVTVTAVPDSGYMFVKWEGDITGETNPTTITMDDNKSVTAVFDVEVGVDENLVPEVFSMDQNYPNPFNPATTIRFGLPEAASVTLQVFDVLGREVATLHSGTELEAGYHNVIWNGMNKTGHKVSSGIYIYRISAKGSTQEDFISTLKMIMLK